MMKFSGEERDLYKTLLKFIVMFWKNLNFLFFFFLNSFLHRGKWILMLIFKFDFWIFNPFDSQIILSNENNDPDITFFNEKREAVDSPYYNVDKFKFCSQILLKMYFLFCISTLDINKNFEKLLEYLSHVKKTFLIIALTEMWCSDDKVDKSSLCQLRNCTAICTIRYRGQKGESISFYVHHSLNYKIPKNKNIDNNDIKYLNIEILSKTSENVIISCI